MNQKYQSALWGNKQMNKNKKIARIVGVLFIIGTAAGMLGLLFVGPILGDPNYLIKFSESKNQVIIGVLFIITMGITLAMIPVIPVSNY